MRAALSVFCLLFLAIGVRAEESVGDLLDRLDDPNPFVKVDAIDELARREAPEGLVPMILLLRNEAAEVRAHAADGLRLLGDPVAVPFLHRMLEDLDDTVRCRAILALGELADRYIVPSLRRHLTDPSVIARAAAIRALGEVGDPLTLPDILKAQAREAVDLNRAVTAAALIAAAKIGGKKGLDRSLRLAGKKLTDSWFLRATAARAIGLADDRSRIPLLVSFLAEDPDARTVQAAAAALGTLEARAELIAVLEHGESFRRKAAVVGLGSLEGPEIDRALVSAAADTDPGVVLEAADVLASRGYVDSLPVLIRLLEVESVVWMGALASLKRRTGEDFGRNPPRWWEWHERNRRKLTFDKAAEQFRTGR